MKPFGLPGANGNPGRSGVTGFSHASTGGPGGGGLSLSGLGMNRAMGLKPQTQFVGFGGVNGVGGGAGAGKGMGMGKSKGMGMGMAAGATKKTNLLFTLDDEEEEDRQKKSARKLVELDYGLGTSVHIQPGRNMI